MIPVDAKWKTTIFDALLLIASVQNTFTQAYYAAFGLPENYILQTIDFAVEGLFVLDIIFHLL